MVQGNNARGFAKAGIDVGGEGKSDRVQVRGNSIDVAGMPGGALAIAVAPSVARVLVADNVVTGASGDVAAACVKNTPASGTHVLRDNVCW
jgi:hypothetical protein